MKAFFQDLLNNVIASAAVTAAEASQSKSNIKGIGLSALAGAMIGAVQTLLTHPLTLHPAVGPAVTAAGAKAGVTVTAPVPAV